MTETKRLFRITRQGRTPLYELIEHNFRELVSGGHLKPGEPIPSEWDLAELYGVSRLTVRQALENLKRQGWLDRRHGVGTFVAKPPAAQIIPSRLSFSEQMRALGRQPSSRQICIQPLPAPAEVAAALGLEEQASVTEIIRVRLADGEPILLETAYVSQKRFPQLTPDTDLSQASLYEFLAEDGHTPVCAMTQTLEPVLLDAVQAGRLDAQPGTPAIRSEVIAYSEEGEPIEYSWSVTRGDRCKFYFSFRRGDPAP